MTEEHPSDASASRAESFLPNLRAAVLLSRPPLITRSPGLFESTYYDHTLALRSALSNPTPEGFYFKPGSLPLRRFQKQQFEYESTIFGSLAGAAPEVDDIPVEKIDLPTRNRWETQDLHRGEQSLNRLPEDELYLVVKQGSKWEFPSTEVERREGLDEAVKLRLLGPKGKLGGETMDAWVVTRSPVGWIKQSNGKVRRGV